MPILFWTKTGPKELPKNIKRTLVSEFGVEPGATAEMRYLEKTGKYARRNVHHIRIVDAVLSANGAKPVRQYDDLADDHKALLFEGYVDDNGYVRLSDRRRPDSSAQPGPSTSS